MAGKMKDEAAGVTIKEFVRLNLRIYLFLIDCGGHKKAKFVNKKGAAVIGLCGYKEVLLNIECLRDSMNRIQSKDHGIETFEINERYIYPKQWI